MCPEKPYLKQVFLESDQIHGIWRGDQCGFQVLRLCHIWLAVLGEKATLMLCNIPLDK